MHKLIPLLVPSLLSLASCTTYHSKQALSSSTPEPPAPSATFVSEEDSGLMLLSFFTVTEPDHYAVLLERARRRHRCQRMRLAQLDFYTDSWFVVAFPIARVTLLCEQEPAPGESRVPQGSK